jgi:hypothetical protein
MVNQIDSPDGKPRKDPNRPSPSLVKTDDAHKAPSPSTAHPQAPNAPNLSGNADAGASSGEPGRG